MWCLILPIIIAAYSEADANYKQYTFEAKEITIFYHSRNAEALRWWADLQSHSDALHSIEAKTVWPIPIQRVDFFVQDAYELQTVYYSQAQDVWNTIGRPKFGAMLVFTFLDKARIYHKAIAKFSVCEEELMSWFDSTISQNEMWLAVFLRELHSNARLQR